MKFSSMYIVYSSSIVIMYSLKQGIAVSLFNAMSSTRSVGLFLNPSSRALITESLSRLYLHGR